MLPFLRMLLPNRKENKGGTSSTSGSPSMDHDETSHLHSHPPAGAGLDDDVAYAVAAHYAPCPGTQRFYLKQSKSKSF
jgi:hypothetical protein